MIEVGEGLTRALDKAKVPINGAFWLYLTESERWRLVFASRRVNEYGPRRMYEDIQRVLATYGVQKKLFLSDITVMETNAPLFVSLRKAIKTGRGLTGIRFGQSSVNGHYVEDAYIYRLT